MPHRNYSAGRNSTLPSNLAGLSNSGCLAFRGRTRIFSGMSFERALPLPVLGNSTGIRELDLVTLAVPVRSDEGHDVPAGSVGTVVGIWAGGSGFEVEFLEPFEALATVRSREIGDHRPFDA